MVSPLYSAHGALIRSPLPLTAFNPAFASDREPEIQIEVRDHAGDFASNHGFQAIDGEFHAWFSTLGEFRIGQDGFLRAWRNAGVTDDSLRLAMLGSMLAVALFYRGILPLHGNALLVSGEGILIVGEKGQGKSTLTAGLLAAGHRLISDDVSGISFDAAAGAASVHRGSLQLKLWPDSIARCLGRDARDFPPINQWIDKRIVSAHAYQCDEERAPLRHIYVLGEDAEHSLRVEPLKKEEALRHVMAHSHPTRFGSTLLQGALGMKHFLLCSKLAQAVPVTHLFRPRDFDRLPETVQFIGHGCRRPGAVA